MNINTVYAYNATERFSCQFTQRMYTEHIKGH